MTKFSLHHFDETEKRDYDESGRTWKSFKSWGPFLALIVFIFASGGIFYSVEKKLCFRETQLPAFFGSKNESIKESYFNVTSNKSSNLETNVIKRFRREVYSDKKNITADNVSTSVTNNELLSYWAAVHFVATTITTIGYGDIVPCSPVGQFLAIFFATVGIPLMLICLAQIGKWLEHVLNRAWHWARHHKTFDSNHDYANDVPLSLGLAVTFTWILLSSIYFYFTLLPLYTDKNSSSNAEFTYFTACYFSIITFLTIGYGDVAPINHQLVISTFIFIFVGLALVTMCIDILQTKLENMFDNMVTLIQNEYKKNVVENEEKSKMATDSADISQNVQALLKSTGDGKMFGSYMNKRQKERLLQEYKKQANMVNKSVQATVQMTDHETQIYIDMTDNETQIYIDKKGVDVACQAYRPVWQRRLPIKKK